MKKFGLILIAVLCIPLIKAEAQKTSTIASNIKYRFEGAALVISYNLPESGEDVFYKITLRVTDSASHRILLPKSVSGDIGSSVKGGPNKSITWTFAKDSITLSKKLSVAIDADSRIFRGGPTNALRSLVIPGWGDYYVYSKKGNPAFLITIVSYGCVGYGIYNTMQSAKNYQSYHNSVDQKDMDNYYDQAVIQQNTGTMFIAIGAAVWAADIVNVAIKGAMNAKGRQESKPTAYLDWNIEWQYNGIGARLCYKF
jgi:hypothetical protein